MSPIELEAWRKRLGLKQHEAAAALNISIFTYKNWAYGRRRVPTFLRQLCEFVEKDRAL